MNQAEVSQLVSKLRIRISPRHKNLKTPEGPQGRLNKLRKTVNALFKYERLELNYTLADETRGYAERVRLNSFVFRGKRQLRVDSFEFHLTILLLFFLFFNFQLISEAIRHGDTHKPTMEMADYWIEEKQLIHKLFKVLVPRYNDYTTSYTMLYRAPKAYPETVYPRSVLELKGLCYIMCAHFKN